MGEDPKVGWPRRGEVYLVAFDPTLGAEIKKTRPALIIKNDLGNRYSPITIVAAITRQLDEERYPTEVFIHPPEGGLRLASLVQLNQIRSIDKQRLGRRLDRPKPRTMLAVNRALSISVGLVEL